MNKTEILNEYKNQEERILVAKILDKIEFTKTKNKIQATDFLNITEQEIALNILKKIEYKNYYFFGGNEGAERKVLIIYPEKLTEEMSRKNDNKIITVIRIKLPNDLKGEYNHRIYLGAVTKVGIEREKVGDILVEKDGADIVIKTEALKFLMQNLSELTRFKSSTFENIDITKIKNTEINKIEISVIIISLRLDNIVSTLAKTSRSKAQEILKQERVFLNHKLETKASKEVKEGDIITIRGKGRFEFKEIIGNTKKGRYILKIDKFI